MFRPLWNPRSPWPAFALAGAVVFALLTAVTVAGQASASGAPGAWRANAPDLTGPAAQVGWG